MPTRLIREGINESAAINELSDRGEIFYRRLMSVVDDYGRCEVKLAVLRAKLFGMKIEKWSESDVATALEECSRVEIRAGVPLVSVYDVSGRSYLQINNFGQRTRTESKFPGPEGNYCALPPREGKVYFILAEQSKRVKIGYTEWLPELRLSSLQTGSSEKLTLLGSLVAQPKLERDIHSRFTHLRRVGEWFDADEELLAAIASYCAPMPADARVCPPMPDNAGQSPPTRAQGRSESESESESESYAETDTNSAASGGQDLYDWFRTEYGKVQTVPEDLWRRWPALINTPEQATKLRKNLPLWTATKKFREGFAPKAMTFLREGQFLHPPPASLGAHPRDEDSGPPAHALL